MYEPASNAPLPATHRSFRQQLSQNVVLAAMQDISLSALEPFLSIIPVAAGTTLQNVGEEVDRIYFPLSGVISRQFVMPDGRTVDTAMVGRNGALGLATDIHTSRDRWIARTSLTSVTVSRFDLRCLWSEYRDIRTMCVHDGERLLAQIQRRSASHALLPIEARFSECLLVASDLLSDAILPFSQELMAEMLAVRRTSITEVASRLKADRIVDYSRGKIRILDREGLSKRAQVLPNWSAMSDIETSDVQTSGIRDQ